MATRRERVILDLQDDFTPGIVRAAAATKLLDRELHSLSGRAVNVRQSSAGTSRDFDNMARSANRADRSINQLTGRLRLFADAGAILGPSLAPIGAVAIPAITGLASQAGFAAVGLGAIVVAAQGVGDALKAVNAAALEPTAANLEKARQAMAQIGPDAQAFVSRFQEIRPILRDIRDASAAGWFPGLTESLTSLERIAPEVASLFEKIGRTGGNLVTEGAAAFAGPGWADFRSFVAAEAPQALDDLGRTLGNVAKGLSELWMAFGPLNRSFSSWLLDASRGFSEWADGLSRTEGFREFVEYVQENGPRVADALLSVSKAVIEIVEAIAPLGGPSLKIIEVFADAVAAIADSDLGTPILAGVAALALYNRTLQVTAALQTRLTGSQGVGNALATGGAFGATRAGAKGAKSSLATLRTDVATIGTTWLTAGAQSERGAARMNAAMGRTKASLAPIAKGTALVGGLALATSGAADSFGLANTASLAMMGTIAGPWGAAIGGGIGLLIDLAKAAGDTRGAFEDAIKTTTAAAGLGDLATAEAALKQAKKNRDKYISDANSSYQANASTGVALAAAQGQDVSQVKIPNSSADAQKAQEDYEKAAKAVEDLRNKMATAALTEQGFTADMLATADAAGVSSAALLESVAAINARTAAANGAFSAETRWREALKAATEQANNNNAGIKGNSKAALENRSALEALSAAWSNQKDAMVAAEASPDRIAAKYRNAKKAFIETATAMGVPIEQAKRLAKALLAIPDKKKVDLTVDDHGSLVQVNRIKDAIAALRGKTLTIDVIRRTQGMGKMADAADARGSASGSTVPKDGGPYSDRFPYLLAPGEEVISNRHGQADRNRPLLKAINAGLLANGGTAGIEGLASGGTARRRGGSSLVPTGPQRGDSILGLHMAANGAYVALTDWIKELEANRDVIQSESEARTSLVKELGDTVGGKLSATLFPGSDIWSAGGAWQDLVAKLTGSTGASNAYSANVATLQSLGLDEPGALNALLSQASPEEIASLAASATAESVAQYEQAFQVNAAAIANAQNVAMAAQTAALSALQVAANAKLDQINAQLAAGNKTLSTVGPSAGKATGSALKKGAGNASRNRKRG